MQKGSLLSKYPVDIHVSHRYKSGVNYIAIYALPVGASAEYAYRTFTCKKARFKLEAALQSLLVAVRVAELNDWDAYVYSDNDVYQITLKDRLEIHNVPPKSIEAKFAEYIADVRKRRTVYFVGASPQSIRRALQNIIDKKISIGQTEKPAQ